MELLKKEEKNKEEVVESREEQARASTATGNLMEPFFCFSVETKGGFFPLFTSLEDLDATPVVRIQKGKRGGKGVSRAEEERKRAGKST